MKESPEEKISHSLCGSEPLRVRMRRWGQAGRTIKIRVTAREGGREEAEGDKTGCEGEWKGGADWSDRDEWS